MRRRDLALCAFVVVMSLAAAAQTPGPPKAPERDGQLQNAKGTATIRGRVVRLDTGQPLRRARISARRTEAGTQAYSVGTDADGRFEIRELPAGRYQVAAAMGGFVAIEYGQRRPLEPGRPLVITDGQIVQNVNFTLPPGSVITGRVVDDFGDAVTGSSVQVHRYRYVNGQRQLMRAGTGSPTDDRGQFRVYGLLPGQYYVSAAPPGGLLASVTSLASGGGIGELFPPSTAMPDYVRTYYPDTPSAASAQPVSVGVGEEAPPLTIQLVAARMTTVSGLVLSGGGGSPPSAFVTLRPRGSDPTQILANANMTQAQNGTFNITGVAPGDYTVEAIAIDVQSRPTRMAHGSVDIIVGGTDIKDLVITTSFGVTARGRITFEDSPAPPEGVRPNQVRLAAPADNPSLGAAIGATVRDDWTFEITGLAGSRTLGVIPPSPWTLKRITRGTTDITDAAIDFSGDVDDLTIILTQRATEVSGSVGDSRGAASTDYVAVWFADDRAKWGPQTRFIKTARPDQEGRYRIRGLPPGRYLAVAVDYLEPGEELDPERLEQFRRGAVTVDLREAETRTVDLKVLEF